MSLTRYDNALPGLSEGTYTLTSAQSLVRATLAGETSAAALADAISEAQTFTVTAPSGPLNPQDVVGCQPAPGDQDADGGLLPQITLSDATLPWSTASSATAPHTPHLLLITLPARDVLLVELPEGPRLRVNNAMIKARLPALVKGRLHLLAHVARLRGAEGGKDADRDGLGAVVIGDPWASPLPAGEEVCALLVDRRGVGSGLEHQLPILWRWTYRVSKEPRDFKLLAGALDVGVLKGAAAAGLIDAQGQRHEVTLAGPLTAAPVSASLDAARLPGAASLAEAVAPGAATLERPGLALAFALGRQLAMSNEPMMAELNALSREVTVAAARLSLPAPIPAVPQLPQVFAELPSALRLPAALPLPLLDPTEGHAPHLSGGGRLAPLLRADLGPPEWATPAGRLPSVLSLRELLQSLPSERPIQRVDTLTSLPSLTELSVNDLDALANEPPVSLQPGALPKEWP